MRRGRWMALLLGTALVTTGFSQDRVINGAMHGEPQPPLEKADFGVFSDRGPVRVSFCWSGSPT